MLRLHRRPDVRRRDLGSETMLFDPSREALHVLNVTSAFLWDLLAQERDLAELERALRDKFEVPPGADVTADVRRIVGELRAAGLIEEAADATAAPGGGSRGAERR